MDHSQLYKSKLKSMEVQKEVAIKLL